MNAKKFRRYGMAALALLFTIIALEVLAKKDALIAFDNVVENFLYTVRSAGLLRFFSMVTYLGNGAVVSVFTLFVALMLISHNPIKRYLAGLLVSTGTAAFLDYLLKAVIERARPTGPIPFTIESSYSFPSGHSTAAMAFYGYLGYFLSQRYPAKAAYIRLVMVVVILLVGASRLYLGVHFPSDVLGGYILGGFCLLLGIEVSERFRSSSSH